MKNAVALYRFFIESTLRELVIEKLTYTISSVIKVMEWTSFHYPTYMSFFQKYSKLLHEGISK